jgi:hypothetical protein
MASDAETNIPSGVKAADLDAGLGPGSPPSAANGLANTSPEVEPSVAVAAADDPMRSAFEVQEEVLSELSSIGEATPTDQSVRAGGILKQHQSGMVSKLQRNVSWTDLQTGASLHEVREYTPDPKPSLFQMLMEGDDGDGGGHSVNQGCVCRVM